MDPVTAIRAGSTVVTLLIFIGIVWWRTAAAARSGSKL